MKVVMKGVVVVALVMSMAVGSAMASSVVGKVWFAEASGIDDSALLYGGACSLSLSDRLWLSAAYLMGTYDDVVDIDTKDAEIVLGYSANIIDFGVGGRVTSWELDGFDDDFLIFGPMVYVGAGNTIGNSPLGWYVGGSYMFLDLGDAYDADSDFTFEHYNVEGGLFLAMGSLSATVGYRYKEYTDSDVDLDFRGFVASAGIGF